MNRDLPLLILNVDPFINRNHKYEVVEKRKSSQNKKLIYSFIREDLELSGDLEKKIMSLLFKQSKSSLLKISNKSKSKSD